MADHESREIGGKPLSPSRWALLLALAPALLFLPFLARGERLLPYLPVGNVPLAAEHPDRAAVAFEHANWALADRIYPILSDQLALRAELGRGHLPTWEPNVNFGAPLFAHTLSGPLYPPNALALLAGPLDPSDSGAPLAFVSFLLAGLGLFLFLRRLALEPGAAFIGALAFQLGGFAVGHIFYFMKVDAALYLPWMLWALEGIARQKKLSGFALTLSVCLSLLAGFPPISFFCLTLAGLYALVRATPFAPWLRGTVAAATPGLLRRLWLASAVFVALGVLGAALQVVPMFEASRNSLRQDKSPEAIAEEGLPVASLLGTVVPDLTGSPTDPPATSLPVAWWLTPAEHWIRAQNANAAEWNTFVGGLVVALALVALVTVPRRAAFPAVALLGCYGFAQAWPLVRLAYHLPAYNIGAPARVLSVAWMLWPWLAALGAQALLDGRRRALATLFAGSALLALFGFAYWTRLEPEIFATRLEEILRARYPGESLERIRAAVPPELARRAGERLVGAAAHVFAAGAAGLAAAFALLSSGRPRERFGTVASLPLTVALWGGVIALGLLPVVARGFPHATTMDPRWAVPLGAVLLGTLAWRKRFQSDTAQWVPLALAILCEGLVASVGHLPGFAREHGPVFPPSPALEVLREATGDGRVVRIDTSASGADEVLGLARPNMLQVYGVGDMSTHAIFTPKTFIDLCVAVDPQMLFRNSGISRLSDPALLGHPILDLLRVTSVLSVRPLEHPRLEEVLARPGFHVYRRTAVPALARIVPRAVRAVSDEEVLERWKSGSTDPTRETLLAPEAEIGDALLETEARGNFAPGQIESIERPSKRSLRLEIWGSSGGWLVVHEQYAEGWIARVNGEPAPLVRADHACRAIPIPKGESLVELEYAPDFLGTSLAVSLASLLVAALLSTRFKI